MKFIPVVSAAILLTLSVPLMAEDTARQKAVAGKGSTVMPFSLEATTHVFTKTPTGGTEQVVAKNAKDADQVRLTREHLASIAKAFAAGDFSSPEQIHGNDMPGLAALKRAKRTEIEITYAAIDAGGQITFMASDPTLVHALHEWFDAQLSDHGHDAMQGHDHMSMGDSKK
jgi:hypothetical protein